MRGGSSSRSSHHPGMHQPLTVSLIGLSGLVHGLTACPRIPPLAQVLPDTLEARTQTPKPGRHGQRQVLLIAELPATVFTAPGTIRQGDTWDLELRGSSLHLSTPLCEGCLTHGGVRGNRPRLDTSEATYKGLSFCLLSRFRSPNPFREKNRSVPNLVADAAPVPLRLQPTNPLSL